MTVSAFTTRFTRRDGIETARLRPSSPHGIPNIAAETFLKEPADDASRRDYQRDRWGRSTGETCVIELSGLPATSFRLYCTGNSFVKIGFDSSMLGWLPARPKFAVIYGKSQSKHGKNFWKDNEVLVRDSGNISTLPFTTIAFAPQPTAPGLGNQYWLDWEKFASRSQRRVNYMASSRFRRKLSLHR